MRKRRPLLYDNDLKLIGPLDGATRVDFADSCEDLSTATFTLPLLDPMNDDIVVQGSYIRLYDGEEDRGFYRVTDLPDETDGPGGTVRYACDSAACTLLDGQMPGYHQIGDIEMRTADCVRYILGYQDSVRWVLGRCEFDDAYTYSFSSANLLDALYAIGEAIVEPHQFIFDSTVSPWTVHLVRMETAASCLLVKGRNARSIRRRITGSVITRLYAYGYGEGDNQLTIASVNGGKPYINADTIGVWGVRCGTHTDTRQTDPATLKAHTQQLLEQAKNPEVSYEAEAVDIARYSGESWDNVRAGALARVLDYRFKSPLQARVLTRTKQDVLGDNPSVRFTLNTASRSTADELNALRDSVGIHELYAQGATTVYAQQFADNATPAKPAVMKFRIPTNVVRFNSILLSWDLEKYRSPVAGAASGGGSERTSSAGGGLTVSTESKTQQVAMQTGAPFGYDGESKNSTGANGGHDHGSANTHRHTYDGIAEGRTSYTSYKSAGDTTSVGNHTHDMYHAHKVNGEVTIPPLQVKLDPHTHTVTVPEHTHEAIYDIFEGPKADSVTLIVDGAEVPSADVGDADEIDICRYMRKNDDGKIVRGTWHTVQLVPDKNTRVVCNLFVQVFLQSRGAGDY